MVIKNFLNDETIWKLVIVILNTVPTCTCRDSNVQTLYPKLARVYRIILFGYLHERARWIKSYAVIGYPSGKDGAILPARGYSEEKFLRKP